jgi:hypothetical protein
MLRLPEAWLALVLVSAPYGMLSRAQAQQSEAAEGGAADAAAVDEARRLFGEGLSFVEREDWVQAEERFRRVLALRSSHVVSYNLASALVHLDRVVEAAELLRSILRATDVDPATREATRQLLLETEPRIGTLTLRVSGDMTGTSFTLDGKPLELTAQVQTIAVDPGEHQLSAQRDATQVASQSATVGGVAPLQVEVELVLPAVIAPAHAARTAGPRVPARAASVPISARMPLESPREDEGSSSTWLWVAGGGAVAAAAAVTVVLLLGGDSPSPVAGDTDPKLITGRVP